jgi:hypothetical protein
LIESAVAVVAPGHLELISKIVTLPMAVSELSMILWLLIKGARRDLDGQGGTDIGKVS